MDAPESIARTRELRQRSEAFRLDAIRARIGAANALCSIAQTQSRWESPEIAERTLQKIETAVEGINGHISDPRHVPAESREELQKRVSKI